MTVNQQEGSVNGTSETRERFLQVSILALLFGTGSWIALTGLWLEMPLLLQRLPESWSLASHMNLMIELANVGPLLYWVASWLTPLVNDITATHAQIWLGFLSCLVLMVAWKQTVFLWGSEHSLVLLSCTFGLALVDCTSSVTFLPFMARFDTRYLTPYLIGEGLSGLIPSVVALLQGVGEEQQEQCLKNSTLNSQMIVGEKIEPRFSVEVFFLSLLLTLLVSYLAFICLQVLPLCKNEMEKWKQRSSEIEEMELKSKEDIYVNEKRKQKTISRHLYYYLLFLIFWNNFTTLGFMPSVQPYSALPYGADVLHYIVILASLSYPVGCLLCMWIELRAISHINLLTLLGTGFAFYILIGALQSPKPPLVDQPLLGGSVMVLAWTAFVTIICYVKTVITVVICDHHSARGMFWVGMLTQLGAASGAFLNFALVNYTTLFRQCFQR